MRILGIPSAISPKSISRVLLKYGDDMLKTSPHKPRKYVDIADIGALPLFDADKYRCEAAFPKEVRRFRDQLENSTAVIFSADENEHKHFYSISGPLQNAIDWGLHTRNLFKDKPVAFMSHGADFFNGQNCFHLRLQCSAFGARCLPGILYSRRHSVMESVPVTNEEINCPNVKCYVESIVNAVASFDPDTLVDKSEFHLSSSSCEDSSTNNEDSELSSIESSNNKVNLPIPTEYSRFSHVPFSAIEDVKGNFHQYFFNDYNDA